METEWEGPDHGFWPGRRALIPLADIGRTFPADMRACLKHLHRQADPPVQRDEPGIQYLGSYDVG